MVEPPDWYSRHRVELVTDVAVTELDVAGVVELGAVGGVRIDGDAEGAGACRALRRRAVSDVDAGPGDGAGGVVVGTSVGGGVGGLSPPLVPGAAACVTVTPKKMRRLALPSDLSQGVPT